MIYLDYAAATPMDKRVLGVMEPYFSKHFANPSAVTYAAGQQAKKALTDARKSVAASIGAKPTEITFTAGGTEANNLAIQGVLKAHKANIIISPIEHPSVYETAKVYPHKICQVDKNGVVDIESIRNLTDEQTVLISIILANHEIGTIQPISSISRLINQIRQERRAKDSKVPLYLHTDACQATNYMDLHTSKLGIDLMSVNGSKIYGPKQSGFLWVKTGVRLEPLIYGGGQEHSLRSGTENLPSIVGLAKALEITTELRKKETKRTEELRDYFTRQILNLKKDIKLNGSPIKRVANNIHVTIPKIDNEWLLIKLDEAGIAAAAGSACSASNELPSSVLSAIGLSEKAARQSIRFSLGRPTTKEEIDKCVKTLSSLI